jgi:hypothetical protein
MTLLITLFLQKPCLSKTPHVQEVTINVDTVKTKRVKSTSKINSSKALHEEKDLKTASIGVLFDTRTSFSEQYNMANFLKINPVRGVGDIRITLQEEAADFHLKGQIGKEKSEIKYYVRGKLAYKLNIKYKHCDLTKIFLSIRGGLDQLVNGTDFKEAMKVKSPKIFTSDQVRKCYNGELASNYLPHKYRNTIPYVATSCRILRDADIPYYPILSPKEENAFDPGYAAMVYSNNIENLFFFRSQDVPSDVKSKASTLIAPVNNRPGAFAWYLASADTNKHQNVEFSKICYNSCILSLNNSLSHTYQKYKIKKYVYGELKIIEKNQGNMNAFRLYDLAEQLIEAYLKIPSSMESYQAYRELMDKTTKNLNDIEREAKKIREQRIMASINAGINYANAIAISATGQSSSLSDSYALAGQTLLQASFDQSNLMRTALEQYADGMELKSVNELITQNDYREMLYEAPVILDIITLVAHTSLDSEKQTIFSKLAKECNDPVLTKLTKKLAEQMQDEKFNKNFIQHLNERYVIAALKETRR